MAFTHNGKWRKTLAKHEASSSRLAVAMEVIDELGSGQRGTRSCQKHSACNGALVAERAKDATGLVTIGFAMR